MSEVPRFDGETFNDGDGIDFHASKLTPTSQLPAAWLKAAHDAMMAASRHETKREPTPAEVKAGKIADISGRLAALRRAQVEQDIQPLAA